MTKSLEAYFSDWEGHVFGYGYGSGEPHVVPALRRFVEQHVRDLRIDYALETIWNGVDGNFGLLQANKFIEDTQPKHLQ